MDKITLPVRNMSGEAVGSLDLDPRVFGVEGASSLVQRVVRWQLAKRRAGTHSTLTRSMMKGGGKKPFKQKGTGSARAGSSISPLWVGGAVVHGPHPRSYAHSLPKQVRRKALCALLSERVRENRIIVVDSLVDTGKTRDLKKMLGAVGVDLSVPKTSTTVVVPEMSEATSRSSRNLRGVLALEVGGVNAYDVLRHRYIVGTREGLLGLQSRLLGEQEA